MYKKGSSSAHKEKVLIIMNNDHADEVRKEIERCNELRGKTSPAEARVNGAIVTALQMIYNKPDGWYDTELREKLARSIVPRLSRVDTVEAMKAVYAVVKPCEEDKIRELRDRRRKKISSES